MVFLLISPILLLCPHLASFPQEGSFIPMMSYTLLHRPIIMGTQLRRREQCMYDVGMVWCKRGHHHGGSTSQTFTTPDHYGSARFTGDGVKNVDIFCCLVIAVGHESNERLGGWAIVNRWSPEGTCARAQNIALFLSQCQ